MHLVERLAAELAVSPLSLLLEYTDDGPPRTVNPSDRVAAHQLAAAVAEAPGVHRDDLAGALGWSLQQIDQAAHALKPHLNRIGWHLAESVDGTMRIAADRALLTDDQRQRLLNARLGRQGLNVLEARLVWRALFAPVDVEPFEQRLGSAERAAMGRLMRMGVVERHDGEVVVSDSVWRNLAIPDPELDLEDPKVRAEVTDDELLRLLARRTGPPLRLRPPPGRRVGAEDE